MAPAFGNGRNGGFQFGTVMALIIAGEDVAIEFLPILERMARGAEADDRFAGIDGFADAMEFLFRKGHAANKENGEVGGIERFEAGNGFKLWIFGTLQNDGFDSEVLLQIGREWRKAF